MDLPILGDMDLRFCIDRHEFEANVSVSSAIDDFLLKSEWLIANGATWNFTTGAIKLGDRESHAYQRTLGWMCRHVMVSETVVVPARHEANVPVKVLDNGIPHPTEEWAVKPHQLKSRVMPARTLFNGSSQQFVARVCNYSDELYELVADSYLARAEPVEPVPETGGQLSRTELARNDSNMSVLPDQSSLLHPTAALRTSIVNASQMAGDAGPDSPMMEKPNSHVQCLINGLPDDLMTEQCACAEAFIKSRTNVFSHSEYDIGWTRIIPHHIDTGDNAPHFEQLRRHPTTQLLLIDEHMQHMLEHDVIEPAASLWCSNTVMVCTLQAGWDHALLH